MADYNYAISDYVDFEFHVKQAGRQERSFVNQLNIINTKFARKEKMAEKGLLSADAGKRLADEKMQMLAEAYAEHIIFDWKGEFKGKKLGKYSAKKCAEILSDPENDELFADLIDFSRDLSNFTKEQEEAETKN